MDETDNKEKSGIREKSAAIVYDSSDEEDFDECEPITSVIGSKYMDQLKRLSLSVHVFCSVLE